MAVVDDVGSEIRFLQRNVQRVASAHAPADRADPVFPHVGLRCQEFEGGVEVALHAVFRHAASDFVRHIGRGCDCAAIPIDGQRQAALVCEAHSLILHPIIQAPPFVNHDQRGVGACFGRGCVENALDGLVAALVGHGLAVGGGP